MLTTLKKSCMIFSCIAILTYGDAAVDAYVLSGPHVIDLMTKKIRNAKNLLVSQTLLLYSSRLKEKPAELQETLKYNFPESFRSEIQSENVQRIHVVSKGAAITVIDGTISADPETKFDFYKYIILYHSRQLLQDKLLLLGVDVFVSSLGRFQDKIAYVIGAQYPDESVPQLWIDKDTFIPFRWITIGKNTDSYLDPLEVRYLKWREVDRIWYPMHIQFFQNNLLLREIKVDHMAVDVFFSKDIFDIERIKSAHPSAADAGPEQPESGGLNEVQKTIEDFKKIFD